MLNRVLAEAFGGWKQHASERRQERQIVAQVAEVPVRSLARRTWGAWWEAYQHKLKMRSAVQKLMHGTAIRVLHHWQVLTAASYIVPVLQCSVHETAIRVLHYWQVLTAASYTWFAMQCAEAAWYHHQCVAPLAGVDGCFLSSVCICTDVLTVPVQCTKMNLITMKAL